MEYEEDLVHNVWAITQNAIMFITFKVKDNVLHMMAVLVSTLQPSTLQNPVANPLCTLLKVPNALIINQVCMPLHKLKAAKPQPNFAKA